MKKLLFVLVAIFTFSVSFSQVANPVKWSWRAEKIKENEYKLIFEAIIDKGWHTYSQFQDDGGAVPTSFKFEKNPAAEFVGKTTEFSPNMHEGIDDAFQVFQRSFADKATFTQIVKTKSPTIIKGEFEYMVCFENSCLPPTTKSFSIDLSALAGQKKNDPNTPLTEKKDSSKTGAIVPVDNHIDTAAAVASTNPIEIAKEIIGSDYASFFNKEKFGEPINLCGEKEQAITSWVAIVLGFLGGFIALFTPCVFPMIPLTISYFTKRAEKQHKGNYDAIFYGAFIILIFVLLSLPFLLFNLSSNTLHAIATNIWVNLAFFVIFIIFAFSFFGFYEIQLPTSLANKTDAASNAGGLGGIFFMALTLVIVSFSCTGPILGTLLGSMATTANGKLNLVLGMASFGAGMGLPFMLFAFFPSLLKKLPKSGSWMDAVKIVFGLLELILAIKFLSNADLAGHWGLLKREIFLVCWVILGTILVLYLMGIVKIKDNTNINRLHPVRFSVTILAVAFTLYCFWGLLGKEVSYFSGFLPPNYYSIFKTKTDCPNNLSCVKSYDEGLALSKSTGKPLLIDFTGYNCANCRRMEENIWTDPEVFKLLNEKYIIASLYVDDYERKLPDSLMYISPVTGEKRTSYGHKWSDFQTVCFNANTQPQYVLISPEEKLLNKPWSGYDADAKKYQSFLECGLDAFQTTKK